GQYPNLDRDDAFNPFTGAFGRLNEGDDVLQVQGLLRLNTAGRVAPYVELGGAVVFGQGQEVDGDGILGYGPVAGGGLDFLVGRQLALFVGVQGQLVFPDDAVDSSDPGGVGLPVEDEADFDALTLYGGGLRYFFRPGATRVDAFIDCTTELTVGEAGQFTASVNEDASGPLTYTWAWGDGTTSSGLTASHAYSAPGTYTVTFTAEGPVNTDTETCLVSVLDLGEAPALASCRVSPSSVDLGEDVTVSATVTGSEPFEVSVDFGDGTVVEGLPATHAYEEGGTYTVTITATNAFGPDTCTVTVNVADECDEVTELNPVVVDFEWSSRSWEALGRRDGSIDVRRRGPGSCVVVTGCAEPRERDKLRLSERRAQEVMSHDVANGIDVSRLVARGRGEVPN